MARFIGAGRKAKLSCKLQEVATTTLKMVAVWYKMVLVVYLCHIPTTCAFSTRLQTHRKIPNHPARVSLFGAARPVSNSVPPTTNGRMGDNVAVAGRLSPFLNRFVITPSKWKTITEAVASAVDVGDLLLIAVFGWAILPIYTLIYKYKHKLDDPIPDVKESRIYKICSLMSEIARIAGVVYIVDVVAISLNALGFKSLYKQSVTTKCAQVLYTLWAVLRIVPYKKKLITNYVEQRSPDNAPTRIKILDTLANIVIAIPTIAIVLDELKVPIGKALSSMFAIGGVGTLVFSLASKDITGELVNGIALASANKYDEGDYIVLGDGTSGVVSSMGWIYTDLRGTDDIVLKIPNSYLASQRVGNISRLNKSQVKQTLWFSYDYIEKLPKLIDGIKAEIKASCQNLITDGSRPFRVTWMDYNETHLEVVVNCHFRHPPAGDMYWNTRQDLLLAVARAAKKAGVPFDVPRVLLVKRSDRMQKSSPQQHYGIEEGTDST